MASREAIAGGSGTWPKLTRATCLGGPHGPAALLRRTAARACWSPRCSDSGEEQVVAAAEDDPPTPRAPARATPGWRSPSPAGAGFAADVEGVFGGIDGILLIGAGTLVLVLLILIYRSPIFWVIPFFTVLLAEGASRGTRYFLG